MSGVCQTSTRHCFPRRVIFGAQKPGTRCFTFILSNSSTVSCNTFVLSPNQQNDRKQIEFNRGTMGPRDFDSKSKHKLLINILVRKSKL